MSRLVATIALLLFATPSTFALNDPPTAPPASGVVDTHASGWIWHGMSVVDDPALHGGSGYGGGPGTFGAFTFKGTSVVVSAMRGLAVTVDGRAHKIGAVKVKIDGEELSTISLSQPATEYGSTVFSKAGLADKLHVLELDADSGWAVVDFLQVGATPGSTPSTTDKAKFYLIVNRYSGLAVAVGSDGHIVQTAANDRDAVDTWSSEQDSTGRWLFRNVATGRWLAAAGDSQWAAPSDQHDSPFAVWTMTPASPGYVTLKNAGRGYVLNVFDRSKFTGAWLNVNDAAGLDTQEWAITAIKQ